MTDLLMREKDIILDFEYKCKRVRKPENFDSALLSIIPQIGFEFYAVFTGHDLLTSHSQGLLITNLPVSWQNLYQEKGYYQYDPVIKASSGRILGITWSDLGAGLTKKEREIMRTAGLFGLTSGFTIQGFVPGRHRLICSFARGLATKLTPTEVLVARTIAIIAIDTSHRLAKIETRSSRISLSRRQKECLRLVANGKSDWEIGKILNLSASTVHEYIESARRKYGVQKRTQLVVHALHDGYLSISDIV